MEVRTQSPTRRRSSSSNPTSPVGALIRDLGIARGMTITELAGSIDRSIGYVSPLERGRSGITIATLQKVSGALGVGIDWFFQGPAIAPPREHDVVVRKRNRRKLGLSAEGIVEELLSPTLTGQLELILATFRSGSSTGKGGRLRKGEEAGLVLSGKLDLCVDRKRHTLGAGDSYSLRRKGRHRFANKGDAPAVLLCALTPSSCD